MEIVAGAVERRGAVVGVCVMGANSLARSPALSLPPALSLSLSLPPPRSLPLTPLSVRVSPELSASAIEKSWLIVVSAMYFALRHAVNSLFDSVPLPS